MPMGQLAVVSGASDYVSDQVGQDNYETGRTLAARLGSHSGSTASRAATPFRFHLPRK